MQSKCVKIPLIVFIVMMSLIWWHEVILSYAEVTILPVIDSLRSALWSREEVALSILAGSCCTLMATTCLYRKKAIDMRSIHVTGGPQATILHYSSLLVIYIMPMADPSNNSIGGAAFYSVLFAVILIIAVFFFMEILVAKINKLTKEDKNLV